AEGAQTGDERAADGEAEDPAGIGEVGGGGIERGAAADDVEEAGHREAEQQAPDPEVGPGRQDLALLVDPRTADEEDADDGEQHGGCEPAPSEGGSDGGVEAPADGAGGVAVDAEARDEPEGDGQQAAEVADVAPQGGAGRGEGPLGERRRRCRLPP